MSPTNVFLFAFRFGRISRCSPSKLLHYTKLYHYHVVSQNDLLQKERIINPLVNLQDKPVGISNPFTLSKIISQLRENVSNYRKLSPSNLVVSMKDSLFKVNSQSWKKYSSHSISALNPSMGLVNKFMGYLSLYFESLQALVEGRREVMRNQQFIMDDSQAVKHKVDRFEENLRKWIGQPKQKQQSDQTRNQNNLK